MQYNGKGAITITKSVETNWLDRYPWPIEIMYYQGSEFIGQELRKYLFEK